MLHTIDLNTKYFKACQNIDNMKFPNSTPTLRCLKCERTDGNHIHLVCWLAFHQFDIS